MNEGSPAVAVFASESRQTTRSTVSWRARVSIDRTSFFDCRTFDISLGGVGLLCDRPLTRDVPFLVAIQIPPTGSFEGTVVTSQAKAVFQILSGSAYRIGMMFTSPDDPALAELGAWSLRHVVTINP